MGRPGAGRISAGRGLGTTKAPEKTVSIAASAIALLFLSLQFPRRFTYYLRWEDRREGGGPSFLLPFSFKRKGIPALILFDTSHL